MELRRRLPEQVFYANVWLDNFIFAANDTVSLQHVIDTFLVISSEVNLKLHEFTEYLASTEHSGVCSSTSTKNSSVTPINGEKSAKSCSQSSNTTLSKQYERFAVVTGNAIWALCSL